MNPGTTGSDIGGESKVRNPQVLDVHVAERITDRLVKALAGEHGRYGIREIEQLTFPICHCLSEKLKQKPLGCRLN